MSSIDYLGDAPHVKELQNWNAEKRASFERDYGQLIDSPKALKTLETLLRRKSIDYEVKDCHNIAHQP